MRLFQSRIEARGQPQTHRERGEPVRGYRRQPGGWIRRGSVCSALVWMCIYPRRQTVVRGETAEGSGARQPRGDRVRRTETPVDRYGPLERSVDRCAGARAQSHRRGGDFNPDTTRPAAVGRGCAVRRVHVGVDG